MENGHKPMERVTSEPSPLRLAPAVVTPARTRAGTPCQKAAATASRKRCRMHGGGKGSGAPPSERNGNYRHGLRTSGSDCRAAGAPSSHQRLSRRSVARTWAVSVGAAERRGLTPRQRVLDAHGFPLAPAGRRDTASIEGLGDGSQRRCAKTAKTESIRRGGSSYAKCGT